jgi:MFS family permease
MYMKTYTPSTSYLILLVSVLMLVSTINVADKELLAPVADAVRADLSMTDTQIGAVRSAVFLAALFGQLFWGPLSDRWVRKYIIGIGAILWSSVTWMTAYVGSFPQLLSARAGMSFAEGCFNPSAYALITDTAPGSRQGLVLGLMSLTYPVGTAAALVVASVVGADRWRLPFIMFGVLGIILGVMVFALVREPRRGASEAAVESSGAVYTGKFSLADFRQVLKAPTVLLAFGLDAAQATVNWSIAFWAPTYLTRYQIASSTEEAAISLLPAILGFVLGALLGGIMIDRLRNYTSLAAVWVAIAAMVGGFLLALVVFNLFSLGPLMAAAFFLGLVSYMALPAVNIILFSVVPPEIKATTISASNVILNLVTALVSFLIGLFSDAYGLRPAFAGAVLAMFLAGTIVCLALLRTVPADRQRRDALVQTRLA